MADVFISYAREDRAIAERLADAVQASGKSVWWDRHIKGGSQFSKDIERELKVATHVLVLWSASSIESRWVRDEASHAADSGQIIAATIDGTPAPLGFGQFHTIDLRDWTKKSVALPPELARAFQAEPDLSDNAHVTAPKKRSKLIIAGTAVALVLAGGTAYVATQGFPGMSEVAAQQVTLAILPFISNDDELAAKGIGLSSALSNGLSSANGLTMIASTSSAAAASRDLSAQEIGAQLGATHLLEGQILPRGEDKVRFIMSLVDTSTGRQIWTDSVDGDRQLSAELTWRLVEKAGLAMSARFGTGAANASRNESIAPAVYESYIAALEKLSSRLNPNDRLEAYRLLSRVTNQAPDFAPGHAALALILAHSSPELLNLDESQFRLQLDEAVKRAIQLEPGNVEARAAQVIDAARWKGDLASSIAMGRALLADHPTSAAAHEALATALDYGGHHREAQEHHQQVLAADPLSEQKRVNMLNSYIKFGNFAGLERLLDQCPDCRSTGFFRTLGLLVTNGTIRDFERVWPAEARRLQEEGGVTRRLTDEVAQLASAFLEGRMIAMPPAVKDELDPLGAIFLVAHAVGEEEAIQLLHKAADAGDNSSGFGLLYGGRAEMPPKVRAHPAYHKLFEAEWLQGVVDYRREKGFLAGLPIKPEEAPAEKG